ncbi:MULTISPECIES: hypothetical protein [unclassified Sphingomonas]|nr:hypothetical protein [Sphingomonas sp. Leaf10]
MDERALPPVLDDLFHGHSGRGGDWITPMPFSILDDARLLYAVR